MKMTFESELMTNHKHAEVMTPASKFQALQTKDGHSLFFSIGSDDAFYLTKETPLAITGWTKKINLSQGLSAGKVVTKTFDVSRNAATGNIDLALVVTINGQDALYLSQNNSDSDTSWSDKIVWQEMAYDDPDPNHAKHNHPALNIADVYLAQSGAGEFIVVDIFDDPQSSLNLGFRYYIDPTKKITGQIWNPRPLPGDFEAGKISSVLGRKADDPVDGIYTLGEIAGKQVLNYVPVYEYFDPASAPTFVELCLPPLASALAVAPNADGSTSLFVTGGKALYFFAANQQKENSQGKKIVVNDIFAGVQNLYADATGTEVFVWGLNQLGDIFYLKCPTGQETNSNAWSFPVPILEGVEQITPYVNNQSGHSIIFAHLQGDELVQLTQDPHSAIWQQRNIALPPTEVNDVIEYKSFSTHIQVLCDDHLPLSKPVTLSITSKSPVGIYVNNLYHKLSAEVATDIKTEATGALTIIQETQSLSAMCYHIVEKKSGATLDVNPMNKLIDTISNVKNGDDLGSINVTDEKGNTKKLVAPDTPSDQTKATADALQQFVTVSKTLPADGSEKHTATDINVIRAGNFVATRESIWGISFAPSGWVYHHGEEAMAHIGMQVNAETDTFSIAKGSLSVDDIGKSIVLAAENFWNWLKSAWHKVEQFFVHLVEDVYHFFIQIGDALYRFVIRAIHSIVNAVEFVFNKIKTFFEDLIKWLGFIFNWQDILRTHDVAKNLFKQYAAYCIANISDNKARLQKIFTNLENDINKWAGLPPVADSASSLSASSPPRPGQHSPQSNWGVYHAHNNVINADPDATKPFSGNSTVEKVLKDILALFADQDAFQKAHDRLKETIDNISKLSMSDIVKRIVAVFIELLLDTAENVVLKLMDVIKDLVEGVVDLLDTPIRIPVISWLYKLITNGNELSFLDLICLVVSIPATIIYKLFKNEVPFPDDSTTDALKHAPDFATIQRVCSSTSPPPQLTSAESGSPQSPTSPIPSDIYGKLAFSSNCMAFCGSILLSLINGLRTLGDTRDVPKIDQMLAGLAAIIYFPYASPSIIGSIQDIKDKNWAAIMGEAVADVCFAKALLDVSLAFKTKDSTLIPTWEKVSPYAEASLNVIWQIPTTGALAFAENQNTKGSMVFVGGTCFDTGGFLAPVLAAAQTSKNIDLIGTMFLTITVLNLMYGSLMLASAFE